MTAIHMGLGSSFGSCHCPLFGRNVALNLTVPDICSEASAIAASGFQTTPAVMAQYEREENAADDKYTIVVQPHEKASGSVEEMILTMLKPYERPDDRTLIPPRPTEQQLEQAFKQLFTDTTEIIQALGLPAEAASSEPPSLAPLARPAGLATLPFR
jgi:hypothetical protein